MTDRRLFLVLLPPTLLLAACGGEPADEGAAPVGEVLEGSISDAMLPVDRVQSEPPLADPEAFEKAQSKAAAAGGATDAVAGEGEADALDAEPAEEAPAEEPTVEGE